MRKKFERIKGFLTLDYLIEYDNIFRRFSKIHESKRLVWTNWPILSTRQSLLNDFWFNVLLHYLLLLFLSGLLMMLIYDNINKHFLVSVFIIGVLSYWPLYTMLYRPIFKGQFVPQLDNVIAVYEGKEKAWQEKCKQEQLSTRGLVLLYYILDKCAEINYLTPSDKSASLLLKIFGVSQKGLKNELDLLFKKEKRAKIEQRKQTEIAKSFEEVYGILEEMQFPKGVQMLKELEIRFNRPE